MNRLPPFCVFLQILHSNHQHKQTTLRYSEQCLQEIGHLFYWRSCSRSSLWTFEYLSCRSHSLLSLYVHWDASSSFSGLLLLQAILHCCPNCRLRSSEWQDDASCRGQLSNMYTTEPVGLRTVNIQLMFVEWMTGTFVLLLNCYPTFSFWWYGFIVYKLLLWYLSLLGFLLKNCYLLLF